VRAKAETHVAHAQFVVGDGDGIEHCAPRVNGAERVCENRVRVATQLFEVGHGVSLRGDEWSKLSEASLAYAAHHQEVFGAAERAVTLAMLDDARRERRPDAGQLLKLFARRMIN
jgi:hypothetical protein